MWFTFLILSWLGKQLSVDHPKGIKVSLAGLSCLRHMCGSINARIGRVCTKDDKEIVVIRPVLICSLDAFQEYSC